MASRIIIPAFTRRKPKSRNTQSKLSKRLSFSKDPLHYRISNYDIPSLISLSRSPIQNTSKHSSSIFTTKEFPSSTPRISEKLIKNTNKRRNSSKKSTRKSLSKPNFLSKLSKRKENLRYLNENLEESSKNFNGVSTPPEEFITHQRTFSPFSDIIDEQLNRYINSSCSRIERLELPKSSFDCVDDSYQYSNKELSKKNEFLERQRKIVEPPKTPPPFSIFGKIKPGNFRRLSSKKYK